MFRSRRTAFATGSMGLALTALLALSVAVFDPHFASDHKVSDWYHRRALDSERGPRLSDRVVYLTVTDETYDDLAGNGLDRGYLARVHRTLAGLAPAAIAYDIIFARPSATEADRAFARALAAGAHREDEVAPPVNAVFLPAGFALCDACNFHVRESGDELDLLFRNAGVPGMANPEAAYPLAASRGILPAAMFGRLVRGHGHVSAPPDADRILRHLALVIRVGDRYVPTLAFAVFLDRYGIALRDLNIEWGRAVTVPARFLDWREDDLRIPIDDRGRVYVPFAGRWNADFPQMRADNLLRHAADPGLEGNLFDLFADRFVFVGDVSTGATDAADTPLEARAPLVVMHAHLLNALFTGDFYARLGSPAFAFVLLGGGLLLAFTAMLRVPWVFYVTYGLLLIAVFAWGYVAFVFQFLLVPTLTGAGGLTLIATGTFATLRVSLSRERTRDLRQLYGKLVSMHQHLEELVTERTRDLNASLAQIEADLETARHVQQKILPPRDLSIPGIRYHYEYLPLDRVGGDFIDIAVVRPGVLRIFVADAVGHGVQASLLTMTVKSEYEDLKMNFQHPHELLEEYNRRLYQKYDRALFTYIPCFLVDVHYEEGRLRHASSGMPDQLALGPDGRVTALVHTGPAVGFLPDVEIETVTGDFPPGSRLIVASDGLSETHNPAGELFGEEGIFEHAARLPCAPDAIVQGLLTAADAFRGERPLHDDVTLLALYREERIV